MARPLCLPILSRMGNWAMKKSDTKVWCQLIIIMTICPRSVFFLYILIIWCDIWPKCVHLWKESQWPFGELRTEAFRLANTHIMRWAVHAHRTAPNEQQQQISTEMHIGFVVFYFLFENEEKMHFFLCSRSLPN